jgi:hypothetical protein
MEIIMLSMQGGKYTHIKSNSISSANISRGLKAGRRNTKIPVILANKNLKY